MGKGKGFDAIIDDLITGPEEISEEIIAAEEEETSPMALPPIPTLDQSPDAEFEHSQKKIVHALEIASKSLEQVAIIAPSIQHPDIYNAISKLLKEITSSSEKLVSLREKMQKIKGGSPPEEKGSFKTVNVENAVFVGSTADLIRKERMKEHDDSGD